MDARVQRIFAATSEIMKVIIAKGHCSERWHRPPAGGDQARPARASGRSRTRVPVRAKTALASHTSSTRM
jgi:hypothetical protein